MTVFETDLSSEHEDSSEVAAFLLNVREEDDEVGEPAGRAEIV